MKYKLIKRDIYVFIEEDKIESLEKDIIKILNKYANQLTKSIICEVPIWKK